VVVVVEADAGDLGRCPEGCVEHARLERRTAVCERRGGGLARGGPGVRAGRDQLVHRGDPVNRERRETIPLDHGERALRGAQVR
jgi:hypothetical protein